MEWILLVCWLTGAEMKCDEPVPKKDYSTCIEASSEIVKRSQNVMIWCKPKPEPKTYEI